MKYYVEVVSSVVCGNTVGLRLESPESLPGEAPSLIHTEISKTKLGNAWNFQCLKGIWGRPM